MTALIVLDETMAYGFKSAAGGWSTSVVPLSGGQETRNQSWVVPRRRYEFAFANKPLTDIRAIAAFVDDRRGMLHAWLLKDWLNYQLTSEIILTAAGGETTAQIIQTVGPSNAFARSINHIKAGTLVVRKNLTTLTLTTHYTVSATGLITFVTPLAAADSIAVTAEFYIKVRFETDMLGPTLEYFNTANISGISAIEVLE